MVNEDSEEAAGCVAAGEACGSRSRLDEIDLANGNQAVAVTR